ncbi:DUF6798 domain-containing protein [Calditrichota bacterium]
MTTFLIGYHYALGDNVSFLPHYLHNIDPSLYNNDPIIDPSGRSSPRILVKFMVLFLSSFLTLPLTAFILTALGNSFVVWITFVASKWMFDNNKLTPFIASVLAVSSIRWGIGGGNNNIIGNSFLFHNMSVPLVLLSVLMAIRYNPIQCAVYACLAAIIHPLYGLVAGAMGLTTCVLWFSYRFIRTDIRSSVNAKEVRYLVSGILLFALFTYLAWLRPYSDGLSKNVFMDMLLFRNPHHIMPSQFAIEDYIQALLFLGALIISWKWWRANQEGDNSASSLVLIFLIVHIGVLIGGYVFVELVPVRVWVVAMVFRTLGILRWIGFLIIGNTIAHLLLKPTGTTDRLIAAICLAGTGFSQSVLMFLSHLLLEVQSGIVTLSEKAKRYLTMIGLIISFIFLFLTFTVFTDLELSSLRFTFILMLNLGVVYWFYKQKNHQIRWIVPLISLMVLTPTVIANRNSSINRVIHCIFTEEDAMNLDAYGDIARYARNNTDIDALFLGPPECDRFRLWSRRAVLFNFGEHPTRSDRITMWMDRMQTVYGPYTETGWKAKKQMDENYLKISDKDLEVIRERYKVDYAVLFDATETNHRVLIRNSTYKLVVL